MSKWIVRIADPVDPALFVKMSNVFQKAARVPLRKTKVRKPGLYLTDIPMNRGMLTVVGELRRLNIEPAQTYLFRLMHLGEIFQERELFADFIKAHETDGEAVMVSDALLMAAAVAKFKVEDDYMSFDLQDVLAQAKRFSEDGEQQ